MKNEKDVFNDLVNLNADEWNLLVSADLKMPISKIRSLITYRELMVDVGKIRLQINKNLVTQSGLEQIKIEEELSQQYEKIFKDSFDESVSTLKNYTVKLENNKKLISSVACTGKIIIGLDFSNSELSGCYLTNCVLYNCNFSLSNMESSFITSCSFVDCSIDGVDFTGSTLSRNSFISCKFTKSNFTYSVLSDNVYCNCNLDGSNLLQARILFSGFRDCTMQNMLCRDADMGQIVVSNSILKGSDFKHSSIMDAIFTRVNLLECNLDNIITGALTLNSCQYDKKYKHYFTMDHLTYSPAIFEWEVKPEDFKK